MSKKSCCNDNYCYEPCCGYDNSSYTNSYIWILIIIFAFNYGSFWNGYNNAFNSSTFNSSSFSNSPSGQINNFFGSN